MNRYASPRFSLCYQEGKVDLPLLRSTSKYLDKLLDLGLDRAMLGLEKGSEFAILCLHLLQLLRSTPFVLPL